MVARPHHATEKKAAALGFTILGNAEDTTYTVRWGHTEFFGKDAKQVVEDMRIYRFEIVDSEFTVQQNIVTGLFTIRKGRKAVGEGETLEDAWTVAQEATAKPVAKLARDEEDEGEFDDEDDLDGAEDAEDEDAELEDADVGEADLEEASEESDEEAESKSVVKRKYRQSYRPFHATCGDDLAARVKEFVRHPDSGLKPSEYVMDKDALRTLMQANGCWIERYEMLNPGMARMNSGNRLRSKVRKGHVVAWVK